MRCQRESSQRRSRRQRRCARRARSAACCTWWARSEIRWEQRLRQHARGSKFLINGEPTDNRLAVASKGALRTEITAHGKMAHSAYPELGESAINKLLDALQALRQMELPHNPEIGPSTMNIGIIEGGRATNVIPDFAKAQLLYRLVAPSAELRTAIVAAVGTLAEVEFVLDIPYMRFRTLPGIVTMTAAFTTRYPEVDELGRTNVAGAGIDSCRAHRPRVCE